MLAVGSGEIEDVRGLALVVTAPVQRIRWVGRACV